MTRRESGRRMGMARAARLSPQERSDAATRANVTKWILATLGQPGRAETVSPLCLPYRVRGLRAKL
jgi:hypothetical protein